MISPRRSIGRRDDDGRRLQQGATPASISLGSHTFNQPGTFNGIVTLTDNSSSPSTFTTANSTFNVRGTLTPIDMTNTAIQGQLFSGQVASFQNSDREQPGSAFSATINWGDGTTSAGQITDAGFGLYRVSGSHVFNQARTFNGTVTLTGNQPPFESATAKSTFIVTPPSLVVTNTNDSGRGSLRFVMDLANTITGGTITFAVPTPNPHVLHLLSPLPVIFTTVTIDTTIPAPGFTVPPAPFIVDGRGATFPSPTSEGAREFPALIDVDAPRSVIRGLTVQGSSEFGIVLDVRSAGSRVTASFIGTDQTGTTTSAAMGNDLGGIIVVSAGNSIDGNVISGNGGSGNDTPSNPSGIEGFGLGLVGGRREAM